MIVQNVKIKCFCIIYIGRMTKKIEKISKSYVDK